MVPEKTVLQAEGKVEGIAKPYPKPTSENMKNQDKNFFDSENDTMDPYADENTDRAGKKRRFAADTKDSSNHERKKRKLAEKTLSSNVREEAEQPENKVDKYNNDVLEKLYAVVPEGNPFVKYEIWGQIGEGATARVYHGREIHGGRDVAIKMMQLYIEVDGQVFVPRFEREVVILKSLHHKNITRYRDSYIVDNELWLVQEYIDGLSLFQATRFNLSSDVIAAICFKILKALEYIHSKNVIHRDIKAENILLSKRGEVKIADFGHSTQVASVMKSGVGTAAWMAPELISTNTYSTKVDIWSLGITVIELLTGKAPYKGETDKRKKQLIVANGKPTIPNEEKIDPIMRDFLDRCLEPEPEKRATATELLNHKMFQNKSCAKKETLATFVEGIMFQM